MKTINVFADTTVGEIEDHLTAVLRHHRMYFRMESFNRFNCARAATIKDLGPGVRDGNQYRLAVFARAGSNEGHYIHVQLQSVPSTSDITLRAITLFMGKTFHGGAQAVRIAALLSEALGLL